MVMELRLDGTMAIRFRGRFRKYAEVSAEANGEFSAWAADASGEEEGPSPEGDGPTDIQPAGGRSGCTPAEPSPPDGAAKDRRKGKRCPAEAHPWRRSYKRRK